MTDHPILFSAPMVRALLAGTKTQTRRAVKPQPVAVTDLIRSSVFDAPAAGVLYDTDWIWPISPGHKIVSNKPAAPEAFIKRHVRIAAGDRLYVREAWRVGRKNDATAPRDLKPRTMTIMFEAGGSIANQSNGKWEPNLGYPPSMPDWAGRLRQGMHMPRWASRLTLTVSEVRVERLQDISEGDAVAEGVAPFLTSGAYVSPENTGNGQRLGYSAYDLYRDLWNSINGRGSWDANPWVAAYNFTPTLGNIDSAGAV